MKANFRTVLALCLVIAGCTGNTTNAQSENVSTGERVGGQCEGCEAIYENRTPFKDLGWEISLPGYDQKGPKLHVTGVVYKSDGKTPAAGTILYFYHTDQTGIYPQGNETGWGKRHGYIRGWLKTDEREFYQIISLVPASYPNSNNPKHIHPIIKEPGNTAYWTD